MLAVNEKYSILLADPPWAYRVWNKSTHGRTAESHYRTMNIEEICTLPVADIAAKDSALFLWATFPCLSEAFRVLHAWGFDYRTVAFVWVKRNRKSPGYHMSLGHWTRANAEICLLAVRGKLKRVHKGVGQIIDAPVSRHSEKPDEARERIIRLMGDLPRIELFARTRPAGWHVWGNEVESDIDL